MTTLALLLLTMPGASAPAPVRQAEAALQRGEFEVALQLLEPLVASAAPGPELAQVHLMRGRCFAALRQGPQVETAFTLALMNDPEAKLDPNAVSPDVVATLKALSLRLSGRLSFSFEHLQPGDELSMDADAVPPATTPTVAIGRHHIVVRRQGATVFEAQVVVKVGQVTEVRGALPLPADAHGPLSVVARVRVDPLQGAGVELGGELTVSHFRLGITAARAAFFGITLRPSLIFQLNSRLGISGFAEADLFFSQPVSLAVGGGASLDISIVGGLELFAEVSGFYAPLAPAGFRQSYLLLGAGARWRF